MIKTNPFYMHVQRLNTTNKSLLQLKWDSWLCGIMMQQSAHSCSCNSPRVLLNNLTWAVGSQITLYRHVCLLSLRCSSEIRPDHPCWHCVLTLHEMHTIMQIMLKVTKPCSSLRTPSFLSFFLLIPVLHSEAVERTQSWMAAKAGSCSRLAFVIRDALGKQASWGNILKVGTGWNGRPFHRVGSMSYCVSMYSSTYKLLFTQKFPENYWNLGYTFHVYLISGKFQSCALLHMTWQPRITWNIREFSWQQDM